MRIFKNPNVHVIGISEEEKECDAEKKCEDYWWQLPKFGERYKHTDLRSSINPK